MNELVCNYAIARFRPYRETAEFVNVGVLLHCPQVGFWGYAFEQANFDRVNNFFPELDQRILKTGLEDFINEIDRVIAREKQPAPFVSNGEAQASLAVFKELVRPREGLLYFGPVATVLTGDPKAKLDELCHFYIKRQFAHRRPSEQFNAL